MVHVSESWMHLQALNAAFLTFQHAALSVLGELSPLYRIVQSNAMKLYGCPVAVSAN